MSLVPLAAQTTKAQQADLIPWLCPQTLHAHVHDFGQALSEATRKRVRKRSRPLAFLFSGGIDCSVLVKLAHDHLPIDEVIILLNVSFAGEAAPDRITARSSLTILQTACPNRKFELRCINKALLDYQAAKDTVLACMYPQCTEMDISIGMALYWASRSLEGDDCADEPIVLISGLGADEQLGGYRHHAKAANLGGTAALLHSVMEDCERLPYRNLGRDDRVIANNGKEARFPFLDQDVVSYLRDLPILNKCHFDEPGHDKCLLRCFAASIGLGQIAHEKKRAIQFGSRTAKMDGGTRKTKGHDQVIAR